MSIVQHTRHSAFADLGIERAYFDCILHSVGSHFHKISILARDRQILIGGVGLSFFCLVFTESRRKKITKPQLELEFRRL